MASPTAITLKQTAVEEGMLTMKQDGLIKALEGITTIEEVLRVTIS
jgi:type II secretory ATPase GspE/PulE/Tfp pilus assembly ATPase PilB-like protein